MLSLLLAVTLGLPAETKADASATPKVEGKWLIVYAEEGGRRNNAWEQQQAMFKGNTLSYSREGKTQTIKVAFGPHQTVKASLTGEKGAKEEDSSDRSYSGVYIAGQDYFCLSLEGTGKGTKEKEGAARAAAADPAKGSSSGSFILILRRQRDKD